MEFTFKGCKFNIGIPFLSLVTLILILDSSGKIVWCLLAILVHEMGHIICMMSQQKELRKVQFCLFDIKISNSKNTLRSYKQDIILMISGPFANFIIAMLSHFLNIVLEKEFLKTFTLQNTLLGLFNLLPIYSFDGGQILSCILNSKLNENKTKTVLNISSLITLFPILIIGVYAFYISKYNVSLLLISFYIFSKLIINNSQNSRWIKYHSSDF